MVFLLTRLHESHSSNTSHFVRLLWTNDQPNAVTSTWQQTTLTRYMHRCPPAGFETAIPASERPQTHALDRASTSNAVYLCLIVILPSHLQLSSSHLQFFLNEFHISHFSDVRNIFVRFIIPSFKTAKRTQYGDFITQFPLMSCYLFHIMCKYSQRHVSK
jgi:hypothetical protein